MRKESGPKLRESRETIEALLRSFSSAAPSLPTHKARELKKWLDKISLDLAQLDSILDPIQHPRSIFDPSDPKVIGRFVAMALLAQPRIHLDQVLRFYGSGIYALYYSGQFKAYGPISKTDHPIYVGKVDPKMPHARSAREQGPQLSSRLREHLKSVSHVDAIAPQDFECRYLVITSGWQGAAENHLIHFYRPIWNNEVGICFGIGKHGDSAGTRKNLRSPWDTMHPGRPWAGSSELKNQKTQQQIAAELLVHFKEHPPIKRNSQAIQIMLEQMTQT